MLGWSIAIYRQEDLMNKKALKSHELRLARWRTGPEGLDWLDSLVKEGVATVEGNGYPFQYKAKASWVMPLMTIEAPEAWTDAGSICPEDDLAIVAYDQS